MKRTSKAKAATKTTTKAASKTTTKAKRHPYADVFCDTAPLLMALAVVDVRPTDDEDEDGDFGSVWQMMAEQQLGFLSPADRKDCFERAEMVLGLFLATGR